MGEGRADSTQSQPFQGSIIRLARCGICARLLALPSHLKRSPQVKKLFRILLNIVVVVAILVLAAYVDGTTLPVNHTTTVTHTINAPPEKVFAQITNIAAGASWRPEVKSVNVLPAEIGPNGPQDHWVEDLGHGQTMTFLSTKTQAPIAPAETGVREVLLDVPGASYGGTWTYNVSPGPTAGTTMLAITEDGYIEPPLYRFMMHHIFGMTHNLDAYQKDIANVFKS